MVILFYGFPSHDQCRRLPRMLMDVQKAGRDETSASLLSLFNENPDKFISRFVTVDETLLYHSDLVSKAQSMAWKRVTILHLPESFAWSHQPAKSWPPYSGILKELYWLTIWNMAQLLQEHTTLIWLENVKKHWKRRDEESCDAVCRVITCSYVIASTDRHLNCWFQTASPPIVFGRLGLQWPLSVAKLKKNHEKTKIYWWQWCCLRREWLAGGPRSKILLQWHTGFGESLDQLHFCRRGLCWKVTKYHAYILLLTVSGYELFECPSYYYYYYYCSDEYLLIINSSSSSNYYYFWFMLNHPIFNTNNNKYYYMHYQNVCVIFCASNVSTLPTERYGHDSSPAGTKLKRTSILKRSFHLIAVMTWQTWRLSISCKVYFTIFPSCRMHCHSILRWQLYFEVLKVTSHKNNTWKNAAKTQGGLKKKATKFLS